MAKDSEQLQKDSADKERLEKLYQKAQEELDSVNELNQSLKSQLDKERRLMSENEIHIAAAADLETVKNLQEETIKNLDHQILEMSKILQETKIEARKWEEMSINNEKEVSVRF